MSPSQVQGRSIKIRGIVQGVGFRPFVYAQAVRCHLTGWVRNSSGGVEIEINGIGVDITAFLESFHHDLPPLARIDLFEVVPSQAQSFPSFAIIPSKANPNDFIPISADISICDDCTRELFNPLDRRYRYPFINCTNCGPRFSIIQDIPYDRPKTTMKGFPLCPGCYAEYQLSLIHI